MISTKRFGILAFLASAFALAGCDTLKKGGNKGSSKKSGGYVIPTAPGAGWKRVGEGSSVSYIKVNDAADDDVVTLFLATEDTGQKFGSDQDIVRFLRSKGSASMKKVETEVMAGVSGARFIAYQEDTGPGGTPDERESLGLPEREAGGRFYVRTRGFVIADPNREGRLIKMGVSRTSFHGYIGTHFEAIGDSFIESFLTENDIGASAGGFSDMGRLEGPDQEVIPLDDRPPMLDL